MTESSAIQINPDIIYLKFYLPEISIISRAQAHKTDPISDVNHKFEATSTSEWHAIN